MCNGAKVTIQYLKYNSHSFIELNFYLRKCTSNFIVSLWTNNVMMKYYKIIVLSD